MEFFLFCALAGAQAKSADLSQFVNYSTGEGLDEWLEQGDYHVQWLDDAVRCAMGIQAPRGNWYSQAYPQKKRVG